MRGCSWSAVVSRWLVHFKELPPECQDARFPSRTLHQNDLLHLLVSFTVVADTCTNTVISYHYIYTMNVGSADCNFLDQLQFFKSLTWQFWPLSDFIDRVDSKKHTFCMFII